MTNEASYIERNARELARLRALVERASDDDLRRSANADWTVAAELAHMAFWDARVLVLADKLERGVAFSGSDEEPDDVAWINDSFRPFAHALAPREAARLALRIAEETDGRVASLAPALVARTWPLDPGSPLNPLRASHRSEHLDEIEAALSAR